MWPCKNVFVFHNGFYFLFGPFFFFVNNLENTWVPGYLGTWVGKVHEYEEVVVEAQGRWNAQNPKQQKFLNKNIFVFTIIMVFNTMIIIVILMHVIVKLCHHHDLKPEARPVWGLETVSCCLTEHFQLQKYNNYNLKKIETKLFENKAKS